MRMGTLIPFVVLLAFATVYSCGGSERRPETEEEKAEVIEESAEAEEMEEMEEMEEEGEAEHEEEGESLLDEGKELFESTTLGTNGKSCATCHPGGEGLAGKAAEFPKFVNMAGKEVSLVEMVNVCVKMGLEGEPIDVEGDHMKALVAYLQSL